MFSPDGTLISASAAPHCGGEVGGRCREVGRPGVQRVPEGSGGQGKMEKTDCKIICGAPTTLAVKGLMMMMMNDL